MLDAQAFIERKKQKLEEQAREKQDRGLDQLEVELRRQVKEIYTEAELREYEARKQEQSVAPPPPAEAALEPIKAPKRRRSSASNRALRRGSSRNRAGGVRSGRTSGVRSGRNSASGTRSSTRRRGPRTSGAAPVLIGIAAVLVVLVGLAALY